MAIRSIFVIFLIFYSIAAGALEVEISLAPDPRIKVAFIGITNLPDDTDLMVTITRPEIGYFAQAKAKVAKRSFSFGPFTMKGSPLAPGWYILRIDSPIALFQSKTVQSIIGNEGQYMSGKFVKPSVAGGNVVELVGNFEIIAGGKKP